MQLRKLVGGILFGFLKLFLNKLFFYGWLSLTDLPQEKGLWLGVFREICSVRFAKMGWKVVIVYFSLAVLAPVFGKLAWTAASYNIHFWTGRVCLMKLAESGKRRIC
jgi:hypothetical protein